MADPSDDFQWMRFALDHLYDEMSAEEARLLLYNEAERMSALDLLRKVMLDRTPPLTMSAGDLGDNLFQALLAIRIKFERDEGTQKVELNIAMRKRSR
jgi:hypothetical protein